MDAVRLLLAAGADVNSESVVGGTALMFAAQAGRTATTAVLLAAGADADAAGENGLTALKIAERHDHAEVVKLLR